MKLLYHHWGMTFLAGVLRAGLGVAAVLVMAAGPQRGLSLEVPAVPSSPLTGARRVAPSPRASRYEPAPLPNRDIDGPVAPRAGTATTVAPSLFTRNDTYRGEGFGRGSSATAEQERRVRPGAGINLRMPLSPN